MTPQRAPSSSGSPRGGDPHGRQRLHQAGAALEDADAAMVMVHGRGATAPSILDLARHFAFPERVAYLAPQAAGRAWYPNSFLAPLDANEPGLSSGLGAIGGALERVAEAGLSPARTLLLGFSQGACLSLEYAARHLARGERFGGVIALAGALIGMGEKDAATPPDDKRFDYDGDLYGTPVFLGCSDHDPHIPAERVRTSGEVFRTLGADVELRLYPDIGHSVNEDELEYVRALLADVAGADAA